MKANRIFRWRTGVLGRGYRSGLLEKDPCFRDDRFVARTRRWAASQVLLLGADRKTVRQARDLLEDVADLAAVAERREEDRVSLAEVKRHLIADGLLPG